MNMTPQEDDERMELSDEAAGFVHNVYSAALEELLPSDPSRKRANVVGIGVGVKWSNGVPTSDPAVLTLVSHKVPESMLAPSDIIPGNIDGVQTDVLAVGIPIAGGRQQIETTPQMLAKRIRPAEGGYSVGHYKITAGTIATAVYDFLPGASTNPPQHGIGIPAQYYILSNNHVLANSNDASIGDPILQPGPFDGGTSPADQIARLSRFVPITFNPPVPVAQHQNLVDAAVAQGEFHDLDREIYWIGYLRGWRPKARVRVGTVVKKTGRTTNFTTGRITAIDATIDVAFGGGKIARFVDQIVTTNIPAGGDSGSIVSTIDDVAVGLLFAGSPVATILNQIEHVRSLLRVEVAERIL
jgi:hypothetical protein